MSYQIILSLQVKQRTIITYKHGIYELPNELPNELRLRMLGNNERSGTSLLWNNVIYYVPFLCKTNC